MSRNISINHLLETMDSTIVKKYIRLPLFSYLLMAIGIGILYYIFHIVHAHKSLLESFIILTSLLLILWSFWWGMEEKTYYKHIKTKSKIIFYELFFERNDFKQLIKIIDSANFNALKQLHPSEHHSVKLSVACSEDKSFCVVQGVKYKPFEFAELTTIKELDISQTEELFASIPILKPVTKK